MNGVILIDKPYGKTSHDVVAAVRRILKIRRVGHTGTLDPMATGVLPICVGNATKASDMITEADKSYTAELILGMTTNTLDAEGEVITECEVTCSRAEVENAVMSFVGQLEQIPPMYSAIKQNGKKLYELAREGKTVNREPRRVMIHDINIIEIDLNKPSVTISVKCSKGTYIRTLCEDIGIKLGVGAYMNSLVRTSSAGFDLSECITLDELAGLAEDNRVDEALIPTDKLFYNYPIAVLSAKQTERIKHGVFVSCNSVFDGNIYRVYGSENEFLCIAGCEKGRLRIVKTFWG